MVLRFKKADHDLMMQHKLQKQGATDRWENSIARQEAKKNAQNEEIALTEARCKARDERTMKSDKGRRMYTDVIDGEIGKMYGPGALMRQRWAPKEDQVAYKAFLRENKLRSSRKSLCRFY